MLSRLKHSSGLSFRSQLTLAFALGIFCLAAVTSLGIYLVTKQRLQSQLVEQGATVTDNFAEQSTLALLYQSPESARDVALPILSFPNVSGVAILTANFDVLFQEGSFSAPDSGRELIFSPTPSRRETEQAWFFAAPVYAGDSAANAEDSPFEVREAKKELVGFVQVAVSKAALTAMGAEILRNNIMISAGVAIILLALLLGITNRVTQPIKNLSDIMQQAQDGAEGVRADLSGSREVVDMGRAFNTMMGELAQREEQLKRARDTALASAKIKGEFATTVSHELRTPMNGVMGMLELLQSMDLTDEQREYINIARNSGEELLVLIDDVLDFSKIESGKMKLHVSRFDPRDLIGGITELLSSQARQKRLALEAVIDDDVPPLLTGDTSRIRQILINLVGNSIKFTHQGGVNVSMSMARRGDNGTPALHVAVKDTGIGIPKSAQRLIFEAFSQADSSTTRQFGGTGLGLAICKQLVELMGGQIGVESAPGQGSTFWFTIPVQAAEGVESGEDKTSDQLAGMRVLIVSRTIQSCHQLVNRFIEWRCFQRNSTTVEDALRLLRSAATQGKPYDFLIIDTPLADHSENELIDALQQDHHIAGTHTVVLSHHRVKDLPPNCRSITKAPSSEVLRRTMLEMSDEIDNPAPADEQQKAAHILIVEDNHSNQLVASAMLQRLGYSAEVAENGNAALRALEQGTFDLVLMDCHMPFMNGYTATQLIRGKESPYREIPVIALTANTGSAEVSRCHNAGMNDYLSKPLSLDKLEPKLKQWLNSERPAGTKVQFSPAAANVLNALSEPGKETEASLDPSVLSDLRPQIGDAYNKFIDAYVADTPTYLRNLRQAIGHGDQEQIRYFTHVIKGSSGNVGARRLEQLCQQLENNVEQEDTRAITNTVDEIQAEFTRVRRQLVEQRQEAAAPKPPEGFQHHPRVLVVDDDSSSRIVMEGILEKDGYEILQASNGLEALRTCQNDMPDLVLMDALMPVMDGFTACEKILSLESGTYPSILMITALQDEGTLERAFAVGATDFIVKPINMTVLRQRVSRMLHADHIDRHIHQLSYYDNLTALPNRTFFVERCKKLLDYATEHDTNVAVLFLDLDRFKLINETQGHESGDRLLQTFAKRLEGCVRSADIVARLGGDEFTVVLNCIDSREAAIGVAEKVLDAMREPFTFNGQQFNVSASIGIALFPYDANSISELMKFADTAMFRAKGKGGAGYAFYEAGMETEILRQIELEVEIREALEQDQFVLFYQPQVDLQSGNLTGIEALIRWQHPSRGLVPPGDFIPFAEKSNLIQQIGDWVLNEACRQQREWLDRGIKPVPIAVNVSGGELSDSILLEKVERALHKRDVPADLIKLEITEDTLAGSDEKTTKHLQDLRNLGTTLAIDDFGTGYSSLSYLKLFPVDTLKIDRSFIKDLPDDANSAAIVSGIIALGHSLKMTVVAEGVETEEQKRFLQREGCDTMQGYYLCKPLPLKELETWIVAERVCTGYQGADITKANYQAPRLL